MEIAIFSNNPKVNDRIKLFIDRFFDKKKDLTIHMYQKGKRLLNDINNGKKYNYIFVDEHSCSNITLSQLLSVFPQDRLITFYDFADTKPDLKQEITECSLYDVYNSFKSNIIPVKDSRGNTINLHISDVYYFESYYNNVYAYTKDNKYLTKERSLQYFCNFLIKEGFISIHKSILVNRLHVVRANRNAYELDNKQIIYPSNKRKNNAFDVYLNGLKRQ